MECSHRVYPVAIGYATVTASWEVGLGLRSAIAPLAAESTHWRQLRYGKSLLEFRADVEVRSRLDC